MDILAFDFSISNKYERGVNEMVKVFETACERLVIALLFCIVVLPEIIYSLLLRARDKLNEWGGI